MLIYIMAVRVVKIMFSSIINNNTDLFLTFLYTIVMQLLIKNFIDTFSVTTWLSVFFRTFYKSKFLVHGRSVHFWSSKHEIKFLDYIHFAILSFNCYVHVIMFIAVLFGWDPRQCKQFAIILLHSCEFCPPHSVKQVCFFNSKYVFLWPNS